MVAAGKAGRAGLDCGLLYAQVTGWSPHHLPQCEPSSRHFVALSSSFLWSPLAARRPLSSLVAWATTKK